MAYDFNGLLGNPLLQTGLGILSNNTGHYGALAPALGRGGMQGMQNVQQFQQQQQMNELRKQQMLMSQQGLDIRQKALDAQVSRLNKPADSYVSPVYDQSGNAYMFNHRATDPNSAISPLMVNGKPFVGAKFSPDLKGKLSGADARAKGNYKINTDISGVATTDTKLADSINQFQVPQGVQSQRDAGRTQVLQSELASEQQALQNARTPQEQQTHQRNIGLLQNELGVSPQAGIRVPTKAEEAAQVETAKGAAKVSVEAQADLPRALSQGEEAIKLVDELLAHKGFEPAVGLSSMNPLNKIPGTDARDFNIRLDQIKGKQFLQAFETLKGGGQITEVEGKKATDAIARMDTAASEDEFKRGARDFQEIIRLGMDRAKGQAGEAAIMPTKSPATFDTMPKASDYKGKVLKNPDTGERFRSNGLSWKKI